MPNNIVFYDGSGKKHRKTLGKKFISYLLVQMYKMKNSFNCYYVDMKNN